MNYLFVDASSNDTYGQISNSDKIFFAIKNTNRNLGARITGFCDDLLQRAKISKDEVDLYVSCIGPGSLTGLRIAGSFLRACAFISDKPLIGINLFSWAAQTLKENGDEGWVRFVVPTLIDKAFYVDIDLDKQIPMDIKPEFAERNEVAECDYRTVGVKFSNNEIDEISLSSNALDTLIKLQNFDDKNNFVKMLEVLPMYVIPSQAERKFQEKKC